LRNFRFYCPDLASGRTRLDPSESHHLIHVLRLKEGAQIEVFDGLGNVASAVILDINKKEVGFQTEKIHRSSPLAPAVILGVSMAKGSRFDLAVEKCTELGVDHICAVQFERTVKLGKKESLERYHRIAVSAAKQCGRNYLPQLTGPAPLRQTLEYLKERYPDSTGLYGGFGPDSVQITNLVPTCSKGGTFICMVGPEGGFTPPELSLFAEYGFQEVNINPNILRTETAALAFASLLTAHKL
jgi:16S rRNA (uracil1498-N3)-methyltransferase